MSQDVACPVCNARFRSVHEAHLHAEACLDDHFYASRGEWLETDARPGSDSHAYDCEKIGSLDVDTGYVQCLKPGCLAYVFITAWNQHSEMHAGQMRDDERHSGENQPQNRDASDHDNHTSVIPMLSRSRDRSVHFTASSPPRGRRYSPARPSSSARYARSSTSHRDQRDTNVPASSRRTPRSTASNTWNWFVGRPSSARAPSMSSSRAASISAKRPSGRLGTKELGPHAFEVRMPREVKQQLLFGTTSRVRQHTGPNGQLYREVIANNETPDLIELLADLHVDDPEMKITYLCHPCVRHIHKIRCDGNFCGYWNIQVLMTYLLHVDPHRYPRLPNVLDIQETIEDAWERGICVYGKTATGGIFNTRKWIGTHEAIAYFSGRGLRVAALSFNNPDTAAKDLLDHIEAYFMNAVPPEEAPSGSEQGSKSITTRVPPIYLQRVGHSMTIVGLERLRDDTRNLIVFDSSFSTTRAMDKLLGREGTRVTTQELLKPYRKSEEELAQWKEFEIMTLIPGPVPQPGQNGDEEHYSDRGPALPPRR